jgi:hypothetical protein
MKKHKLASEILAAKKARHRKSVVSRRQLDSERCVAIRTRPEECAKALTNIGQTTNVLVEAPSMEGARAPLVFAHALGNHAVEVVCVTDTALNLGRRLKREK